jgi:hypothetical protein
VKSLADAPQVSATSPTFKLHQLHVSSAIQHVPCSAFMAASGLCLLLGCQHVSSYDSTWLCLLLTHPGSHDTAQTATAVHAAAAKAAAAQATAAAQGLLPSAAACHTEEGAEYGGDVIKWGENHLQVSQCRSASNIYGMLHCGKRIMPCNELACSLVFVAH